MVIDSEFIPYISFTKIRISCYNVKKLPSFQPINRTLRDVTTSEVQSFPRLCLLENDAENANMFE